MALYLPGSHMCFVFLRLEERGLKLRDKKRKHTIKEEEYSHPRHEPYKREHKKPQQWLDDTDSEYDDQQPLDTTT